MLKNICMKSGIMSDFFRNIANLKTSGSITFQIDLVKFYNNLIIK